MRFPARSILLAALALASLPGKAAAGMPSISLSDIARMRIQTLSFFLVCFLLCGWIVQRIWNGLRVDFPSLPRLTFKRSLGLVSLLGLLFLLVLTMISGARELMTPGAWKKEGYTFKLAEERSAPSASPNLAEIERRAALERLGAALMAYARGHEGRFPSGKDVVEIKEDTWKVPDPSDMRYLYVGGQFEEKGSRAVAFEPGLFGGDRLVLLSGGEVVRMNTGELDRALEPGGR